MTDPSAQFAAAIEAISTADPSAPERWCGALAMCGNAILAAAAQVSSRRTRWEQILLTRDADVIHHGLRGLADAFAELRSMSEAVESICDKVDAQYLAWRAPVNAGIRTAGN